jgi:cytoskeletal protein RodZ
MDNTALGSTSLEQLPQEFTNKPHRSSWAVIIVLFVVSVFVLFWWYQKKTIVPIEVVPTTSTPQPSTPQPTASASDLSDIETDLVNTPIGGLGSSL